ncbi:MAG: LacI family DNA-binding transcriptional regulator [Spirochaetota bacterium]
MMNDSIKVTMNRIAKELNVSRTTVYRVVHNKPHVNEKMKLEILKLIEKYDYLPNITAQNLVRKITGTIGVVFENLTVSFRNMFAQYLVQYINERSYRVILQLFDKENIDRFLACLQQDFTGRRIDGLMIDADPIFWEHPRLRVMIEKMRAKKFPFVFLSARKNGEGIPFVSTDRVLGAYKAVSHLIQLGHRRIAYASNAFYQASVNLSLRLEGYRKALQEAGIPEDKELFISIPGASYRDGYAAGCMIAQMRDKPSAVFCVNDIVAIGMLRALREKQIRVPQDMALIGFDNIEASEYAEVPLTTVEQPIRALAEEGVRMLYDRIHNPDLPVKQIYLEPKIIIRASCGAPVKRE